jgi:hypothetical protein
VYICIHLNDKTMKAQIQITIPSGHLLNAASAFGLSNRKHLANGKIIFWETFHSLHDAKQHLIDLHYSLHDSELILQETALSYDCVTAYIQTEDLI